MNIISMVKNNCIHILLLLLSYTSIAQTIRPELINVKQLAKYEASHPELFKECATCPKKEIDGGWKTLINDLPIPADAIIKTQPNNQKPSGPSTPLSPSPIPVTSFMGYVDPARTIPPDTHGAVGPNHVVTATNDYLLIQSKSGAEINRIAISSFTGVATSCDPYIQYDPESKRFFYSAIECNPVNGNKMAILVSNTSDPAEGWFRYSFVPDTSYLLDHPYLGFDNRWVVISGRKFPQSNGSFTGTILFVLDKATLLANQAITFGVTAQRLEKGRTEGDSPLPVTLYGTNPSPNTFYILQSWNGLNTAIRLSTVTGNLPNATWNTTAPDAVFPLGGTPWLSAPGSIVEQSGESRKLATNDSRISNGVMVNGSIWCTHHIGMSDINVAVQWWQLNGQPGSSFGNVIQRGRIGEGIDNSYRWFPSIAVNENEDVLIGYTVSTNTSRVSAAYSFRTKATPVNTTMDEYIYKVGLSTYFKDFGGPRGRWGDYSHSALDPVDGSLWTIQEYADQRTGNLDNQSRYGVWWARVKPASTLIKTDAAVGQIIEPAKSIICTLPIRPTISIRNFGKDTIRNVQVGMLLDDILLGALTTVNNLEVGSFDNSGNISLAPNFTPTAGNHTIKIFTINPNGTADLKPENDTISFSFTVVPVQTLPYEESFETVPFPPANGAAIINPDNNITWALNTTTGNPGTSSIWLNGFGYNTPGQKDIYRTAKINTGILDSLTLRFNVAYQPNTNGGDTLAVVVSTDCGITWLPTSYKKAGTQLGTVAGTTNENFVPANGSQWRTETLSLTDFCSIKADNIMIGFQSINGYGNNLYLDGINIVGYTSSQRNAALGSINLPLPAICNNDYVTQINFSNAGTDTIKTLQLNYQLDGGAVNSISWTGSLAKCGNVTTTLPSGTAAVGTHVIKIFTSLPNGLQDQFTGNDTLTKTFSIFSTTPTATPVFEGFEDIAFPRPNWGVQNVTGGTTFERSVLTAKTGTASMVINNANVLNSNAAIDYFISPLVQNSTAFDSVFVDFDLAYKSGQQYPGSGNFPVDTLEILATKDCGRTFISVWKKWGEALQTTNATNNSNSNFFTPDIKADWKKQRIYLTPLVGADNFQLYFAVRGNKQNNLWLDNINITSQILPQRLKNQGYLIYPNPFNSSFLIHHSAVQPPVDLQSVQVFNAAGQLVWSRQYNGNADRQITVDLKTLSTGVYVLKLIYTNKTIVERIVKQ